MHETPFTMRFLRDQDGGPLVEVTVMIPILLTFLLGSVDFMNAFVQWNQATKAVEVGARIAAVSDPVASGLTGTTNIATQALSSSVLLGDTMPDFQVTCDGNTQACTCTRGTCTGMGTYSATAMNLIVYGRGGQSACTTATSYYTAGMCNMFGSITPAHVKVVYSQTGLGFAGRAAGPVPTITVSIENLQFQYFFLGGLMQLANMTMPPLSTTITGEGLSSAAQ
jgi:Flp pilus assembly protein TadG